MLDRWIQRLESINPSKIVPGLSRIQTVMDRLAIHDIAPIRVLVAGTNGKGSVCALAEASLMKAGKSVAVYSSPHFISITERLRIQGSPVDEMRLSDAFQRVESVSNDLDLTYFEWVTAACFLVISELSIDVALIEVGLGGRLDATNVITPTHTVITRIGMDHQEWLGDTLEAIAAEKAGICRAGVPCFLLKNGFPETTLNETVIGKYRAETIKVDPIGNIGDAHFLPDNLGLAYSLCSELLRGIQQLQPSQFLQLARHVTLAGRQQIRQINNRAYLFDVAHNEHSVEALSDLLKRIGSNYDKIVCVFSCLRDKEASVMMNALNEHISEWLICDTRDPRSYRSDQLQEILNNRTNAKSNCFSNISKALTIATELTTESDLIAVTGSFVTVSEAIAVLDVPSIPFDFTKQENA